MTDYGTLTGGDELLTFDLRDGLRARGHDARVFTSDAKPLPEPVVSDYTCRGTTSRWRTLLQSANPFAAKTLRQILAEFDPQVVHVRSFLTQLSPSIMPVLRGRPTIVHFDTLRAICPIGSKLLPTGEECREKRGLVCLRNGCLPLRDWLVLTPQLNYLDRNCDRNFDLRVANSAFTLGRLRNDGVRVDTHAWNGAHIPTHAAERSEAPTVAFAGRLVPEKGVDVLLRAAVRVVRTIPETRILIAGDGPSRAALEELCDSLQLQDNVEFLGQIPRDELAGHIGDAWVQVIPSVWPEPFGLATAEAMARATPVVASASGGSVELIRDGDTGLLVEPGDDRALADAVLSLLENREDADDIGRRAREFAIEHLSVELFVERFEQLYRLLLDRLGRSRAVGERNET
jgi:glycosyltransferase involved in cell wall biosynthesis